MLEGYGISFDKSGELYYKGEFEIGFPNGIGTIYPDKGNRYEGQVKKGKKGGYGIMYHDFENAWMDRYEGEFKNDMDDGYGIMYFKDGGYK